MEYPEFTIESKTMTPAEVKAALDRAGYDSVEPAPDGAPAPPPPPEPEPSSSVPPPAPGNAAAGGDETPAGSEPALEPQPKPKGEGGFKKKITRLQSENDALRRQLEEFKSSAKSGEAPAAAPKADSKPPEAAPKPKWEDFADAENQMEAWGEALTDWKLSERDRLAAEARQTERAKAEEEQLRARADADSKERMDRWNAQLAEAREAYPDFDAVTVESETPVPMSGTMITAMFDSDHGAKLAYWLGKHPEESERIAKLTEIPAGASDFEVRRKMALAVREFAKIEDKIGSTPVQPTAPAPAPASRETRPAPVATPASPAKPTPPPPPPVPVGSRGSAQRPLKEMTAEEIRSMDPMEYRRRREAGA